MKKLQYISAFILLLASACGKNDNAGLETNAPSAESPVIASDLSNQQISSFAEDSQGHIWIGTFRGLNKFNVHEYHQYFCTDDSLDLPDNNINDILRDSKGQLWVVTVNGVARYTDKDNFHRVPISFPNKNALQILEDKDGRIYLNFLFHLAVYNPESDSFEVTVPKLDPQYTFNTRCFISKNNKLWAVNKVAIKCYNTSDFSLMDSIPVTGSPKYSYLQDNGLIWLAGNHDITLYDTNSRNFILTPAVLSSHPVLRESNVEVIYPYDDNSLLLATDTNGLFLYNFKQNYVIHETENGFPFAPPSFKIRKIFKDSQNNLWFGSEDHGYTVRYHFQKRFNTNNYLHSCFRDKSVVALGVDRADNLWIATRESGLYIYNINSGDVRKINSQNVFGHSFSDNKGISRIFVDNDNNIWLASNSQSKVFKCHLQNGAPVVDAVYDILLPMSFAQDSSGTIWLGTSTHQLYAMRKGESEFSKVSVLPAMHTFIPGILPAGDGKVWVTSFMNTIKRIDSRTWDYDEAPISKADWESCIRRSVYIPTAILKDSHGDIWLGTVSNGILRYNTAEKKLVSVEGTPCLDISSIEEDAQGNIWVSTLYGLGKFDRTTGRFTNYYAADGIGGNQYYDRSSCQLPDGSLVFGGTHGLTIFNPMDVGTKRKVPLLFEDLKVHNTLIRPENSKIIDKSLSYKPEISLLHDENGFCITFAALDYCDHERVHYFYQMEGFDKYWIDAGNNREAYYANLPAGTYDFKVKITNNDKSIVEIEDSIRVIVRPAPWLSWWAWVIYALLMLLIIGVIVHFRNLFKIKQETIRLARLEKEQEKRVNKMNMSFFANISHEFRTPLTMISGPISQLCKSPDIKGDNKKLLYVVQRSVGRMLRLVNQLMDFNKLENDTLRLHVKWTDIISQLQGFIDIFRINANEKGITLSTSGLEDTFLMWLDVDKLDKIISNLLSNALKFTSSNGNVTLCFDVISNEDVRGIIGSDRVQNKSQYVKITVTDSGNGIPENQLEKIFERYYQLDNQSQATLNWGTGIGLYYSRSLARLHHGFLFASNRQDTTGAVLTLLLPVDDSAYTENEKRGAEETQTTVYPLEPLYSATDEPMDKDEEKPTILVVDDDTEVVHYLKALLSPYYKVVCRFDADSAFQTLSELAPDFVLSDVVMPGRDGLELCQMIKSDPQLCHIPVILVTAKSTVDNQIEGLNTGAVAYVTKPFDPNYLLALLKSMLINRDKVRGLLSSATQIETIEENVLSPQDNAFMTELYALMESELSNPELDVAHMTQLMKISRTKFYYKIKGLTGENPSAFFKTYKLNRAAELLKTGKYTISEVADMTGFNTLSHFSTSFKKQFGTTPSEYGR